VVAAALILLHPFFPQTVFRILGSLDRLAMLAASLTTSAAFHGDRISYPGLRDVTLFNVVLILVTGMQTGLLGACTGLILSLRSVTKAA
jgi:hypothetical protein